MLQILDQGVKNFQSDGFVLLPGVFKPGYMQEAKAAWDRYATENPRTINQWNPVEWPVAILPQIIREMWAGDDDDILMRVVKRLTGWKEPLLYNRRFVVKDPDMPQTPLHQDSGYHSGFGNISVFVAFTECRALNGGIKVYRATHKYGYLGDVGEINPANIIQPDLAERHFAFTSQQIPDPSETPLMYPGDVLVMDSNTWHESGPNNTETPRVIMDLIIQERPEKSMWWPKEKTFIRSRTSRLIELQAENDRLKRLIDGIQS